MFSPNSNRLVYWANIEFSYDSGSKHFGEFEGGFVYCFVQAVDVRDALDQFNLEFRGRHLGIRFIEFISLYAEIPWQSTEDQGHYDGIASRASISEEVMFDSFEIYERR